MNTIKAVFLDLDGTLLDTAKDMTDALNKLLAEENKSQLTYNQVRIYVSKGADAILQYAFNKNIDDNEIQRLRNRYLELYKEMICVKTKPFDGIPMLLEILLEKNIPWGVVTNKSEELTHSLLAKTSFVSEPSCVVCGDTLKYRKPDPRPLMHAAELVKIPNNNCVYVGDDIRDMQAGNSAGMLTLAAAYGYISDEEDINEWPADGVVLNPTDVNNWLT